MIVNLSRPISDLNRKYSILSFVHLAFLILTIIIVSGAYLFFMKSSDLLFFLRTSEDYFLILALFFLIFTKGKLILHNLIPFMLVAFLGCIILINKNDSDFLKSFTLFMLWYTVTINAILKFNPETLFRIVCSIGIISSLLMILNTEQFLLHYISSGRRIHTEGEGLEMNINNISLTLTTLCVIASVIERKYLQSLFSSTLINILLLVTAIPLAIGQTRSALIIYFLVIAYRLFYSSFRTKIVTILLLIVMGISIAVYFNQFGSILNQVLVIGRVLESKYLTSQRVLSIFSSLDIFSTYPTFGFGSENLLKRQVLEFGAIDHNYYTKLLGSYGLMGFIPAMIFFYGLLRKKYKSVNGILFLQVVFLYNYIFIPSGAASVLIASFVFYINKNEHLNYLKKLSVKYTK